MKKIIMNIVRLVFRLLIVILFLPILLCALIVYLFGTICDWTADIADNLETFFEKIVDGYFQYWIGFLREKK